MGEFEKNNVSVFVATPKRCRKPVLFVRRGGKASAVATFNSKEDAEVFEVFMTHLMGAKDDSI